MVQHSYKALPYHAARVPHCVHGANAGLEQTDGEKRNTSIDCEDDADEISSIRQITEGDCALSPGLCVPCARGEAWFYLPVAPMAGEIWFFVLCPDGGMGKWWLIRRSFLGCNRVPFESGLNGAGSISTPCFGPRQQQWPFHCDSPGGGTEHFLVQYASDPDRWYLINVPPDADGEVAVARISGGSSLTVDGENVRLGVDEANIEPSVNRRGQI